MLREIDVQSLHSDSVASSTLTNGNAATAHGTTVEMLRELVKKRIITLTYLRNVHEGCAILSVPSCYLLILRVQTKSLVPHHHDHTARA